MRAVLAGEMTLTVKLLFAVWISFMLSIERAVAETEACAAQKSYLVKKVESSELPEKMISSWLESKPTILAFGETHNERFGDMFYTQVLERMKEVGFEKSCLLLEMPKFTHANGDQYQGSLAELAEVLKGDFSCDGNCVGTPRGDEIEVRAHYVSILQRWPKRNLIQRATSLGFLVFAIDKWERSNQQISLDERDSYMANEVETLISRGICNHVMLINGKYHYMSSRPKALRNLIGQRYSHVHFVNLVDPQTDIVWNWGPGRANICSQNPGFPGKNIGFPTFGDSSNGQWADFDSTIVLGCNPSEKICSSLPGFLSGSRPPGK